MNDQRFSPREFLRTRRPEQFSDSVQDDTPILDRSFLEYHLDSLTSRSEDREFEQFARRLAEREICPNLLPQTGPTGGGDSKVDAETYPVADTLSLGWYIGVGREAAAERWAFAFSAKKDWRPKVRSDVAKIAGTGRGYTKAFFITNQFVPDRVRAEVEDELSREHDLDIRILDRTWILDRVFGNRHEALAIEELGIAVSRRKEVRKGPRDTEREQELEATERRIEEALREGRLTVRLVEECIDAALLARDLERPRTEVEGRLARADRIAAQAGTPHQRLDVAYRWAWTAFFWYEDYREFLRWYEVAEERAGDSRNAHDLELLTNLWSLLHATTRRSGIDPVEARLQPRKEALAASLVRLSEEEGRPSNSLQARTLALQMQLVSSPPEGVDSVLRQMREVVLLSEGLVGYPLEPLVDLLTELGGFLEGRSAYEELFETIVEVTSRREGDLAAARMLLRRGEQQLDAERRYEAIRTLGRALRKLYKHESRHDLVRALYLCGSAYEQIRLLWAARGTLLNAASVATNDFWTYSDVTLHQAACYRKLKWLELQLGRIPHVLAWHELEQAILEALGDDPAERAQSDRTFDPALGLLILRADVWQLKAMARLPDVLDGLGLHASAVALLYALGHEGELPGEFLATVPEGVALRDYFRQWRDQPAAEALPAAPVLGERRTTTLVSRLLGCRITVESETAPACLALSESLLAATESLLSTAFDERMIAREPILTLHVRRATFAEKPFGFELQDRAGRPHVEIRCSDFDPHTLSGEEQAQIKRRSLEVLVEVMARVFYADDPARVMEKLVRDELALERALDFTTSLVTLGNVLGYSPRTDLAAWTPPGLAAREYPLRRSEEWDADERRAGMKARPARPAVEHAPGERAGEPSPPGEISHADMETVSLIRESLWNRAGWIAAVYITALDDSRPPVLALAFRDGQAAKEIFAQWREELGFRDAEERLRLVVIRGIDRTNPHAYRIIVGSSPPAGATAASWLWMMSRMHRMDAVSNENLERFLRSYERMGEYLLAPMARPAGDSSLSPLPGGIVKRRLEVREAWQIGRNDPDAVGIRAGEEPIIPDDQPGAPVLGLLREMASA